jgi:hypothetical protein
MMAKSVWQLKPGVSDSTMFAPQYHASKKKNGRFSVSELVTTISSVDTERIMCLMGIIFAIKTVVTVHGFNSMALCMVQSLL